MNLTIITPTCRKNPRLPELGRSLSAAASESGFDNIEWIVVDERLWYADHDDLTDLPERLGKIKVRRIAPKATPLRGPDVQGEQLPAAASARNTGIAHARGDYLFFVDDCQVVATCALRFAFEQASRGAGTRVGMVFKRNVQPKIPMGSPLGGRPIRIDPLSVAGGCFGAPRGAVLAVGGFDEAYDGEHDAEDLDLFVRLGRYGIAFWGHTSAKCWHLRQTHEPVTKRPRPSPRNRKYLRELVEDPSRTTPHGADEAMRPHETPPEMTAGELTDMLIRSAADPHPAETHGVFGALHPELVREVEAAEMAERARARSVAVKPPAVPRAEGARMIDFEIQHKERQLGRALSPGEISELEELCGERAGAGDEHESLLGEAQGAEPGAPDQTAADEGADEHTHPLWPSGEPVTPEDFGGQDPAPKDLPLRTGPAGGTE